MYSKKIDSRPTEERQYPWLGVLTDYDERVVLFTSAGTGTIVFAKSTGIVGLHSADWTMSRFSPFTGQIVLSNSPVE